MAYLGAAAMGYDMIKDSPVYKQVGRTLNRGLKNWGNRGKRARYSGSGAYAVDGEGMDTHYNNTFGGDMIKASSAGDETGSVTLSYREYIGDVYAPDDTSFTNNVRQVNPGLATSFPLLSAIAGNFEMYQFHKLVYTFIPLIETEASGSGINGEVIMTFNDNPLADSFVEKRLMMQYQNTENGKLTDSVVVALSVIRRR